MFEKIGEFFASLPPELYVFIVSILPIVELRAAIPIGAALGLPFYVNYPLAVLGNILPVPFILLFIPKLLDFLGKFKFFAPMVDWLKKRAYKSSQKVIRETEGMSNDQLQEELEKSKKKKREMSLAIFGSLFLFVAVPLPGTGAWMGSLVASLFSLPKRKSFLAIAAGVLLSGVIMTLASYGIVGFLSFLL